MSVITLQFGQCGNQIARNLYSTVHEDANKINAKDNYNYAAVNKWFEVNEKEKLEPRSIHVDAENKAVDYNTADWKLPFKFKNIVAQSYGGSANNWAYGYHRVGPRLNEEVLNCVRQEVEKCDYFNSILNIYGSSGGTGSGVGSLIIEQLRDCYPSKNITNCVILPYSDGEIVTQGYNTVLSLSKSYKIADSTLFFENDRLHYLCKQSKSMEDVTFNDLNDVVAQQLAAIYQPLQVDTCSIMDELTSHPGYKFLQVRSEPSFLRPSVHWAPLLTSFSKPSRFDLFKYKNVSKAKTLGQALISRGGDLFTERDCKPLVDALSFVKWLPESDRLKMYHQTRRFLDFEKHVMTLSNSSAICTSLNLILGDAWKMFTHGAFVHHYKKFEVDEDFFLGAFQLMETVLNNYQSLK